MNDGHRPRRHPAIETAVLGGEAVLYDERSGMVHHLNTSASAIWLLLDGRSFEELVAALVEATGVAPAQIRADVRRAIGDFEAARLLAT